MKSFFTSSATKYLLVFSFFGIVLVLMREFLKHDMRFLFLIKNLFLAWIPYVISGVLSRSKSYLFYVLLFFWLLFFPNALYLVTDFFHLWPKPDNSVWYDLIMIFSFAIVGLFLAMSALKNIENILAKKFNQKIANVLVVVFLYLGSFGVYMGRFMRLNSWDVITAPVYFKKEGLFYFSSPFDDVDFYIAPIVFTLLSYLFYYGIFHFSKHHS